MLPGLLAVIVLAYPLPTRSAKACDANSPGWGCWARFRNKRSLFDRQSRWRSFWKLR